MLKKAFKAIKPQIRCYIATALILLIGWSSAVTIFLTAEDIMENPFSEFENSKRFTNSVERMGGKTALIANDLSKWFSGLWHGESLAYTVGFITFVIAIAYYFIATSILETDDEEI